MAWTLLRGRLASPERSAARSIVRRRVGRFGSLVIRGGAPASLASFAATDLHSR